MSNDELYNYAITTVIWLFGTYATLLILLMVIQRYLAGKLNRRIDKLDNINIEIIALSQRLDFCNRLVFDLDEKPNSIAVKK